MPRMIAARKPNERIAIMAVTDTVSSIGSTFPPFALHKLLCLAVRADKRRHIDPGSPPRRRFFTTPRKCKRRNGRDWRSADAYAEAAQFGRRRNTMQALLGATGAEARDTGGGRWLNVRCLLGGTQG